MTWAAIKLLVGEYLPWILGLALVVTVFGAGYWMRNVEAKEATARVELALSQREAAAYRLEAQANRQALEERQIEIDRLSAETQALAAKLREVYANDPEAYKWSNCELPSSVACLLR